jgi:hypothetical protein
MTRPKVEQSASNLFKWWPIILLLAILVGASAYLILNQSAAIENSAISSSASDSVAVNKIPSSPDEVLAALGRLIILSDAKPSFAIVDEAALAIKATEPFFKDAALGDRILIYPDRAIIYRPSHNIIVNVGPISLTKSEATQ